MKNISDMSILITGGGSGIGEGTASYFVKNGAKVTICGRNMDKLENVSKKLGDSCHAVKCDVTKNDERKNVFNFQHHLYVKINWVEKILKSNSLG